jgi:hypothetical protein
MANYKEHESQRITTGQVPELVDHTVTLIHIGRSAPYADVNQRCLAGWPGIKSCETYESMAASSD